MLRLTPWGMLPCVLQQTFAAGTLPCFAAGKVAAWPVKHAQPSSGRRSTGAAAVRSALTLPHCTPTEKSMLTAGRPRYLTFCSATMSLAITTTLRMPASFRPCAGAALQEPERHTCRGLGAQ